MNEWVFMKLSGKVGYNTKKNLEILQLLQLTHRMLTALRKKSEWIFVKSSGYVGHDTSHYWLDSFTQCFTSDEIFRIGMTQGTINHILVMLPVTPPPPPPETHDFIFYFLDTRLLTTLRMKRSSWKFWYVTHEPKWLHCSTLGNTVSRPPNKARMMIFALTKCFLLFFGSIQ